MHVIIIILNKVHNLFYAIGKNLYKLAYMALFR